jgi:hypothetical protein
LVELFFGLLANKALPMGEREACAHLFAGAIGMFKNPASHRHVESSVDEAKELILLANYLLRLGRRIANASSRLSAPSFQSGLHRISYSDFFAESGPGVD